MDRRYPHYLYPGREGGWPQRIVCVSTVSELDPTLTTGSKRVERLVCWNAVGLEGDESRYTVARIAGGISREVWWKSLAEMLDRPGVVWVLSCDAARDWALLGFWEELQRGTISLAGSDYRDRATLNRAVSRVRRDQNNPIGTLSSSGMRRMRQSDRGYLVCEGPPNICKFRVVGKASMVQWIDSRNYGVSSDPSTAPGRDTAIWLAAWWQRSSDYLRRYKLGAWKATSGSQAMSGWRFGYYAGGVQVHCKETVLKLESASYYGGRCECYRIGEVPEPVYHVDVRSLYPAMCSQHDLPIRIEEVADEKAQPTELVRFFPSQCLASVTIQTDEPAYPVQRPEGILWPVGTFTTVLAGPELADAVLNKRVLVVHSAVRYVMSPWLKSYADSLYAMRCEAESDTVPGVKQLAKSLLVALPGKLGQRSREWIDSPTEYPTYYWGEWYGEKAYPYTGRYRSLAGQVQREKGGDYAADAVPAAAAWITSAGRMRLLALIRLAGWSNVYYCDTDSLMLSERGYAALKAADMIRVKELGYPELRNGPIRVGLYGQKWYTTNGRLVCAGRPNVEVVHTESGDRYWVRKGANDSLWQKECPISEATLVKWRRDRPYLHGRVQADGSVVPHQLGG